MHGLFKDLTGHKFGALTVSKFLRFEKDKNNNNQGVWECLCSCGSIIEEWGRNLRRGHKKSCGCRKTPNNEKCWMERRGSETLVKAILRNYKRTAARRNINFQLSETEFRDLINEKCFYCGTFPITSAVPYLNRKGAVEDKYNGIDRIECSKGYVVSNVVACCKKCNYAKNVMSQQEFLQLVGKIYANHEDKINGRRRSKGYR